MLAIMAMPLEWILVKGDMTKAKPNMATAIWSIHRFNSRAFDKW
jgi:hypothetical protein